MEEISCLVLFCSLLRNYTYILTVTFLMEFFYLLSFLLPSFFLSFLFKNTNPHFSLIGNGCRGIMALKYSPKRYWYLGLETLPQFFEGQILSCLSLGHLPGCLQFSVWALELSICLWNLHGFRTGHHPDLQFPLNPLWGLKFPMLLGITHPVIGFHDIASDAISPLMYSVMTSIYDWKLYNKPFEHIILCTEICPFFIINVLVRDRLTWETRKCVMIILYIKYKTKNTWILATSKCISLNSKLIYL